MGFNYRKERRKFEKQMEENERKYRAAGMSETQISAMRDFEENTFRHERIYGIHIVLEGSVDSPLPVEHSASYDNYFQEFRTHIDTLLDNLVPGVSRKITDQDKNVLILLAQGKNQQETAAMLDISQAAVSKHLKKIRIFLKKGL